MSDNSVGRLNRGLMVIGLTWSKLETCIEYRYSMTCITYQGALNARLKELGYLTPTGEWPMRIEFPNHSDVCFFFSVWQGCLLFPGKLDWNDRWLMVRIFFLSKSSSLTIYNSVSVYLFFLFDSTLEAGDRNKW